MTGERLGRHVRRRAARTGATSRARDRRAPRDPVASKMFCGATSPWTSPPAWIVASAPARSASSDQIAARRRVHARGIARAAGDPLGDEERRAGRARRRRARGVRPTSNTRGSDGWSSLRELLELVEQHGLRAVRRDRDLERARFAGPRIDDLEDPTERALRDQLARSKSTSRQASCQRDWHRVST